MATAGDCLRDDRAAGASGAGLAETAFGSPGAAQGDNVTLTGRFRLLPPIGKRREALEQHAFVADCRPS